jgi:translation elongation factor EF-1beta
MGEVLVRFSIMPDDMENFETLKSEISNQIKQLKIVKKFDLLEQDIAFGMKAIMWLCLILKEEQTYWSKS